MRRRRKIKNAINNICIRQTRHKQSYYTTQTRHTEECTFTHTQTHTQRRHKQTTVVHDTDKTHGRV